MSLVWKKKDFDIGLINYFCFNVQTPSLKAEIEIPQPEHWSFVFSSLAQTESECLGEFTGGGSHFRNERIGTTDILQQLHAHEGGADAPEGPEGGLQETAEVSQQGLLRPDEWQLSLGLWHYDRL